MLYRSGRSNGPGMGIRNNKRIVLDPKELENRVNLYLKREPHTGKSEPGILRGYPLNETGVWRIIGGVEMRSSPDGDWTSGGPKITIPDGTFKGTYGAAIRFALGFEGFYAAAEPAEGEEGKKLVLDPESGLVFREDHTPKKETHGKCLRDDSDRY